MIGKVLWWGVGMRLEGNFIILEGPRKREDRVGIRYVVQ